MKLSRSRFTPVMEDFYSMLHFGPLKKEAIALSLEET
jgi:hypothetical protein